MEQYLEAADKVLDAAIANGPQPWMIKKRFDIKDEKSVKPTGSVYRHLDDGVAIFSSWVSANIQVTLWQFRTHFRGNYRFRISAYGFQTDKPVTFHVTAGTMTAVTEERLVGYFDVPPDKPTVVEFVETLEPKNTIRIVVDGLGVIPPVVEKVGAEKYKGPGLAVQWVEVEGPLHDTWPPASHRRLFGDLPQAPAPTAEDKQPPWRSSRSSRWPMPSASSATSPAAPSGGPVTDEDVKPFLARVKAKLDAKYSFEQAMRVGLKAVLVSPQFLFLREKPGKLDDFALASRLSYFLWSSMPDEELLALAEQGKLSQPDTLREQVERMLQGPEGGGLHRELRRPVARPARHRRHDARPHALSGVRRHAQGVDGQGDAAVLRRGAEERPEPDELRRLRLHDAQRPAGQALRHPRRRRVGVPQGDAAAGQPPRRRADDGRAC